MSPFSLRVCGTGGEVRPPVRPASRVCGRIAAPGPRQGLVQPSGDGFLLRGRQRRRGSGIFLVLSVSESMSGCYLRSRGCVPILIHNNIALVICVLDVAPLRVG
jgi:hypothetical protein